MAEIKKYTRKPDPVQAMQWDAEPQSSQLLKDWLDSLQRTATITETRAYLPVGDMNVTEIVLPGAYIVQFEDGTLAVYTTEAFEKMYEED